jgi:glucan phosphoethanolaminetransferase (alkaline phosphatase superfamily)
MKSLVGRVGFWSAILITVFNVGSTIARFVSLNMLSMTLGFLVASTFVVVMASVHYAYDEKKIFSQLGVAFAIVCAVLLSINYYLQLTVVRWNVLPMLAIENPYSVMWAIEVLGYGFMGLATLFAAAVFSPRKLEDSIRWLFVANGVLGIGGVIGYALVNPMTLFAGLVIWDIVFPLMTAFLAVLFKRLV